MQVKPPYIKYTDNIEFIHFDEVTIDKKVAYAHFVCNYRPLKDDEWIVRLIIGGDKIEYQADYGSPTADMVETKILFNGTISDADKHA